MSRVIVFNNTVDFIAVRSIVVVYIDEENQSVQFVFALIANIS